MIFSRPLILYILSLCFVIVMSGCGGPFQKEQAKEYKNLLQSALNYFFPKKDYEVSTPPPSTRVWSTSKPTFTIQELNGFRDLLEKKQFDLLTKAASEIQANFENDHSNEYKAFEFFSIFSTTLNNYQQLLDSWVSYAPDHFAPYLARATYYSTKAWESRGHAYASETSADQFNEMHSFFRLAEKDIDKALSINPKLLKAYTLRMGIYSSESRRENRDAAFTTARALFPSSFLLYRNMLQHVIPRWGGSYAKMERIANEAFGFVNSNPEMYMLFGQIYADQAWQSRKEEQYEKALALCTKAISYGEHRAFFEERARIYLDMNNYVQALDDINRSIELRPTVLDSYRLRVKIYIRMGELYKAKQDIHFIAENFRKDDSSDDWMQWVSKTVLHQGHKAFKIDLNDAVSDYNLALELNPQSDEAFYWRGVAYLKLDKADLAYSDLAEAIRCNPRNFEAYRMLDYILARQGKWDDIVDLWNRFIALEPNNANAYFERAGTYRHKGDMKNALEDVARACNLGNAEACRIHKQNL